MLKTITSFELNTDNIPQQGEVRSFSVYGEAGAGFYLTIKNEDPSWYNFETGKFQSSEINLQGVASPSGYQGIINFPQVSDADQYEVYLITDQSLNSKHAASVIIFDENGDIDVNASTGSNSNFLRKRILQTLDATLTLQAIDQSSGAGFASLSFANDTVVTSIDGSSPKRAFTITATAANGNAFKIDRQPRSDDFFTKLTANMGEHFRTGLDGEGADARFGWEVTNVVGIEEGMFASGTNITANTIVASGSNTVVQSAGTAEETTITLKTVSAKKLTGKVITTVDSTTKIKTSTATGLIVFNKGQADALAEDAVTFTGYGEDKINRMVNWDVYISDLQATITKPTTTVTSSSGTSLGVTSARGIMDDVSTVSSINIDSSSDNPTVTAIGSYDESSAQTATLTLSSSQSLETSEVLTFDGAGQVLTITGDIQVNNASSSVTIFLDISRFITATVETA
tara:strand:- start:8217 stop:9587 length:1371 start_codon:yes stop_codon:yes gene_type:complete